MFHGSISLSYASAIVLVTMPLQWVLELDSVSCPTLFFFFRSVLAILGLLHFSIHEGSVCQFLSPKRKNWWDFDMDSV